MNPAAARSYPVVWRRHTPREMLVAWLWLAGSAGAAAWSVSALDIEWSYFSDAHEQAADLAARMWPPRWSYLPQIARPLIDTIHIATLGTMIAIVLAIPVAFLAARNTTANGFTWAIGRGLLVGSRSINTVIWGLLFAATMPIRQTYLNGLIPSRQRATIISFDSMMASSGAAAHLRRRRRD